MFDVIIYLFESYFTFEQNLELSEQEIRTELLEEGFDQQDVIKAMNWLSNLQNLYEKDSDAAMSLPQASSHRIYTKLESLRISKENLGFLIYLERAQVLTPISRELVIDCVMSLDVIELDEYDFQWLILMVLYNDPTDSQAYLQLESILFDLDAGIIH